MQTCLVSFWIKDNQTDSTAWNTGETGDIHDRSTFKTKSVFYVGNILKKSIVSLTHHVKGLIDFLNLGVIKWFSQWLLTIQK